MGYTHYWTIKTKEFSDTKWNSLVRDVKLVMSHLPPYFLGDGNSYPTDLIEIKGWNGNGKPEFNDEIIAFNGNSKKNLDHESFVLNKKLQIREFRNTKEEILKLKTEGIFFFCKTARKPYSFLVETTLLLAKKHFGSQINLSSDGEFDDWKFAYDYVNKMFQKYDFKPSLNDMGMREVKDQLKDNVWLSIKISKETQNFLNNMLKQLNSNGVKFRTYNNGGNRFYLNYHNMLDEKRYDVFRQYNNSNKFEIPDVISKLETKPNVDDKDIITYMSNY